MRIGPRLSAAWSAGALAVLLTACSTGGSGLMTPTSAATSASATSPEGSAAMVSVGGGFACALTRAGAVRCWGANERGQLGDGTALDRSTPVEVVGLGSGVRSIAAGGSHACALTVSGAVRCWGANDHGQLGDQTTTDRPTPVPVDGLGVGVRSLAAGLRLHLRDRPREIGSVLG